MSDDDVAREIAERARELNAAIAKLGGRAKIEIDTLNSRKFGDRFDVPMVRVEVMKPLGTDG